MVSILLDHHYVNLFFTTSIELIMQMILLHFLKMIMDYQHLFLLHVIKK